jgi:hypothetical protein
MGNFSKYLEIMSEAKSEKKNNLKDRLDDAIRKYHDKFNKFLEASRIGSDNKVAIFNDSNRKIWEGHIYAAIDYIEGLVKNVKANEKSVNESDETLKPNLKSDMFERGYDCAAVQFTYIPDFKNRQEKIDFEAGLKAGYAVDKAKKPINETQEDTLKEFGNRAK